MVGNEGEGYAPIAALPELVRRPWYVKCVSIGVWAETDVASASPASIDNKVDRVERCMTISRKW